MVMVMAMPGCTVTTDLIPLPTRRHFAFCPTNVDVFGGPNIQLVGLLGRAPPTPEDGLFDPTDPGYFNTLAGRLRNKLMNDSDVAGRFPSSSDWRLRSCAGPSGTLMQLAPRPAQPLDDCGPDAPGWPEGSANVCTSTPAPLVLLSAENVDDLCHGGGFPSHLPNDDVQRYAEHFGRRLDAFLAARNPAFAIVGPQTEWIPDPSIPPSQAGGGMDLRSTCLWKRSDWNKEALDQWAAHAKLPADKVRTVLADLHDEFKTHHPCCRALDLSCADTMEYTSVGPSSALTALNSDGADRLIAFWFDLLKEFLLDNDFECP